MNKGNNMRKFACLLLLICIMVLFNGCTAAFKLDNIKPDELSVSEKLPSLKSHVDLNFFERSFNKSNLSIDYKYPLLAILGTYFSKDAQQNIFDTNIEKSGYIICKVIKFRKHYGDMAGWCILVVPPLIGFPVLYCEANLSLEVNIVNIKHDTVGSYKGDGTGVFYSGFYYGLESDDDRLYEATSKAINNAMDQIKEKINADSRRLSISLNKSMDEIHKERNIAEQQINMNPTTLINGNNYFELKNYSSAIQCYDSVLAEYPYHINVLLNKGKALINTGKYNAAIACFDRVIDLSPNNSEAYFFIGLAYSNLSEFLYANSYYNSSIDINPQIANVYLMRGIASECLKWYIVAVEDYEKALNLDPDLTTARERLNIVQEKIQQVNNQQQQEAEEQRRQNLIKLSNSLNALSNSLSAIGNNNTPSNNIQPLANTPSANSSGNYQVQYDTWANNARSNYETLYHAKDRRSSATNSALITQAERYLAKAQDNMRRIRAEAAGNGVTIRPSEYESISY
jgi:tetratricopeptide (TPR) repeat protein